MTHLRFLACSLALAACSSSSNPVTPTDSGVHHDAGNTMHDSGTLKDSGKSSDGGAITTIAAARQANLTTPITVKAFVTALAGLPADYPNWYIEDPEGGQYSGVDVYCDPKAGTPCTVTEPALHDLIEITGTFETYKGQLELVPTKVTIIQHNATFPPIMALTAADIAPSANSPYRGVFVSLTISPQLVVDNVTPPALANTSTSCGAVFPTDGGAADAGLPACTAKCSPPVYSGFQANDGTGNEVYIEAPFFNTDPLQSSPECLTGTGVVPVTVGNQFSKMQGVLDVDPYSMMQGLSPVLPSDYTLAP